MKVGTNPHDLWVDDADWDSVDAVRIWAQMRHADNPEFVNAKVEEAMKARSMGLAVYLLIDYFVDHPYHSPPPHNDGMYVQTGGHYRGFPAVPLKSRGKGRHEAFGFMHFSWKDGWMWGTEAVKTLVQAINPDYVQQANDPETLNGFDYYKPGAGPVVYNDTMGVFRDGIEKTDWNGMYVVSAWKSRTLRRAREFFGSAASIDSFEFIHVPYTNDDNGGIPVESRNDMIKQLREIQDRAKGKATVQGRLRQMQKDYKVVAAALCFLLNDHDLILDDMFGDD